MSDHNQFVIVLYRNNTVIINEFTSDDDADNFRCMARLDDDAIKIGRGKYTKPVSRKAVRTAIGKSWTPASIETVKH